MPDTATPTPDPTLDLDPEPPLREERCWYCEESSPVGGDDHDDLWILTDPYHEAVDLSLDHNGSPIHRDCYDEFINERTWYCNSCGTDHVSLVATDHYLGDAISIPFDVSLYNFTNLANARVNLSLVTDDGDDVMSCREYLHCRGCSRRVNNHDWIMEEWSDGGVHCHNCAPGGIHAWSYVPTLKFRSLSRDGSTNLSHGQPLEPTIPYLGMEVETEGWTSSPIPANRIFNGDDTDTFVYFKRDGSLGDDGIEIVSHPGTFDWMMQHFPFDAFGEFSKGGATSYHSPRCGIHIHVSADAFTHSHLFKFLAFHYRNPQVCQVIGQRGSVGYSSWSSWLATRPDIVKFAKKDDDARPGDRYMAVNLTEAQTVELRYFRGNLSPTRLRKNIEWVDALYQYTKQVRGVDTDTALRWPAMLDWLDQDEQIARYPNLFRFITERGLRDGVDRSRTTITEDL